FIVSASRSASLTMRRACCSARPMVSAAMRLRLATHATNTAAAATIVTMTLMSNPKLGTTRDVLSRGPTAGYLRVGAARRPPYAWTTADFANTTASYTTVVLTQAERRERKERPRFAVWGGR